MIKIETPYTINIGEEKYGTSYFGDAIYKMKYLEKSNRLIIIITVDVDGVENLYNPVQTLINEMLKNGVKHNEIPEFVFRTRKYK